MTSTTLATAPPRTRPVDRAIGAVSAAALVAAGIWNALVEEHVTVPAPPSPAPGATPQQFMRQHYQWYAGTVGQERAVTVLGIVGVLGLVLLAAVLRRRSAAGAPLAGHGATALGVGGILWVSGQVAALGGHRAVGLMATHGNPIDGVNSIAFTVDTTLDAFSATAFLLFGAAMLALAAAAVPGFPARWSGLSLLAGLASFGVAVGYLQGVDALTTYLLGALAALVMPVWILWTGRLLHRPDPD